MGCSDGAVGAGVRRGVDPFDGAFDAELMAELEALFPDEAAVAAPTVDPRAGVCGPSKLKRRRVPAGCRVGSDEFSQGHAGQAAGIEVVPEGVLSETVVDCVAAATASPQPECPVEQPSVSSLQGLSSENVVDTRVYDAGIANIGNTCYFNAVLTSLSAALPFVDRMFRHYEKHSQDGGTANCLRCLLARDLQVLTRRGRVNACTPECVRPSRRKVWAPTFRANRQQCAGEAFRFLVNALDAEDYNSVASLVAPSQAAALRTTTCAAETFCLQCTVVRTCSDCSDAHSLIETGFGLELALPGKRAHVTPKIRRIGVEYV